MAAQPTLLITGGGGSVGSLIRPYLRAKGYRIRLFSLGPVEIDADEELVLGDVRDRAAVRVALAGCGGVVHLAGCTTDADWPEQIAGNIEGNIAVFEAAREAGVERVIYGSSNHVVGMYPRGHLVSVGDPLRPDSRYGVTKAFGEAIGAFFADKYGLRVLCIRIGNVAEAPVDRRRLSLWISPRDMAQLVVCGIEAADLHFAIVNGVSDVSPRFFADDGVAALLGYVPQDRAEEHRAVVLRDDPEPNDLSGVYETLQGGIFAEREFVGDLARAVGSIQVRSTKNW